MSKKPTAAADQAAADPSTAEFAGASDPQPGEIAAGGPGAEVQPIGDTEAATTALVEARVLVDCEFGKPNDLATVPAERVAELEAIFVIDTHPEAVRFAKRLVDGEITV